jgi:hypothetical protein
MPCRWVECDLKRYDEPVPEFALATAVELHQRVPGIEFRIDEFRVEAKSRDPFLVAVFKGECYYLEVWDEPGYKQERKAYSLSFCSVSPQGASFGWRVFYTCQIWQLNPPSLNFTNHQYCPCDIKTPRIISSSANQTLF